MKIGIYFTPDKTQGGVYTYAVAILESFAAITKHKYTVISTSPDVPKKFYHYKNFTIVDHHSRSREIGLKTRDILSYLLAKIAPTLTNSLYRHKLYNLLTPIYRLTLLPQIKTIDELNLDLIFYPTSSNLSFLTQTPAVVTVHDLQHRLNPQFPEVSAGGRWEHREYGFVNINQQAFKILVDSEVGKKDFIKFYPSQSNRVISLPYLPPTTLRSRIPRARLLYIKNKLNLPDTFIFYPAKFWPHKNHSNLIRALNIIVNRKKIPLNLVLTGSKEADFSCYDSIVNQIKKYKLEKNVHYLGYVNGQEFNALYKLAKALVMPTFFGPTNIPVLEAWVMGTPVIYSDIPGCREQLGNAGLLINPKNPSDIAAKIITLLDNPSLSNKLISAGKKRVRLWNPRKFRVIIAQILDEYQNNKIR